MGITGLLPYLKKASRPTNIKEFKGCTVAVDSYCWLHRGAYACAEKLALGQDTDEFVYYCMKYVNNLLSFDIKPIMVFDGCRLPSKQDVETARQERRAMNRRKAAQLLLEGKKSEARDSLAQSIDITPQMALQLMNACRAKGVDCIVAPYEADAQLAYLCKIGIAQCVITEDSDLVLFGCDKIMFKMDFAGNGMLVDKRELNKAMGLPPELYTFDKFRYACILSGCDYLPNLPGIDLVKATKLFRLSHQSDIASIIGQIPAILGMSNLRVPVDYVDGFFRADNTFLFQLVYDPMKRTLLPLNPYPDGVDPSNYYYAGPYMDNEKAYQIALGNINVDTGEKMADFNPDTNKPKSFNWNREAASAARHLRSIWNTGRFNMWTHPRESKCFFIIYIAGKQYKAQPVTGCSITLMDITMLPPGTNIVEKDFKVIVRPDRTELRIVGAVQLDLSFSPDGPSRHYWVALSPDIVGIILGYDIFVNFNCWWNVGNDIAVVDDEHVTIVHGTNAAYDPPIPSIAVVAPRQRQSVGRATEAFRAPRSGVHSARR